jgi:transposase
MRLFHEELVMSEYRSFVGIDIAAASASVVVKVAGQRTQAAFTVRQTAAGRAQLVERLLAAECVPENTLVVMEATGTYWMQMAFGLHQAGFGVSVINPMQAHHFARALLKRAKTDAVDAATLVELAEKLQPAHWSPPPAVYEELLQRLTERDALLAMVTQTRNRLHALSKRQVVVAAVQTRLEQLITFLKAQIAAIEQEIHAALQQDAAWAASAERLLSIPGVGEITAGWMLVATLNFSTCGSGKEAAAFAGLVPHAFESGTSVRKRSRIGHAGHARLRSALYMAALTAVRFNPVLKVFADRLLQGNKHNKIVLCAVARKLLCIACSLVKHQTTFDPHYGMNLLAPG